MKKFFLLLLFFMVNFSLPSFAKECFDGKSFDELKQINFDKCVVGASGTDSKANAYTKVPPMGKEMAKQCCQCMMTKTFEKYPTCQDFLTYYKIKINKVDQDILDSCNKACGH